MGDNYAILNTVLFKKKYCVYIDHPNYYADKIFVRNGLEVKFCKEYEKDGEKYIFIFCKIRRNDEEKFIKCMDELSRNMLIQGHTDYENKCKQMMALFDKEK